MSEMLRVNAGTQAGIFDTRLLGGLLVDLIEKCHDIQKDFTRCADDIRQGRMQVNQVEEAVNSMELSLGQFNDTLDEMSGRALQGCSNGSQRNAHVEKLRREIAVREERLAELMEKSGNISLANNDRRIQDIREERCQIEHHLSRVKGNIDQTFDELSEVEEKLETIRGLHQQKQTETQTSLDAIKDRSKDMALRTHRILSLNTGDNTIDLSDLYVSPAVFRKLQTEVEDLKDRQQRVERHVQMQLEERAFLRETAGVIVQKVHDLEMKVRQETGDHGFYSHLTTEPNWYQDLGAPNVWHASSIVTPDQLKSLRERQNLKYGTPQVLEINDVAASTSANEEITLIDLTSTV